MRYTAQRIYKCSKVMKSHFTCIYFSFSLFHDHLDRKYNVVKKILDAQNIFESNFPGSQKGGSSYSNSIKEVETESVSKLTCFPTGT